MIEHFSSDATFGDLYVVNGIDDPLRWDSFATTMDAVGMLAPATAITMSGLGSGQIVGTYYAYERFVDAQENYSNLNPISAAFEPAGLTGNLTALTDTTPLVATSPAHALATGDWIKLAGVGGIDSANDVWQITVIDVNKFSLDDSTGTGVDIYTGGGTWVSGVGTITYSSVSLPTQTKVKRRQILRNTDGQAGVFYVDVDTTDLLSTSFTSTQTDNLLSAGTAVPLLDANGLPFANANDPPLNFFGSIWQMSDRMFQTGVQAYNLGHVSLTFGSATVLGFGTHWTSGMAGRFLYIDGATQTYEIDAVSGTGTLTLTTPYTDATNQFAFYSIEPPPAYSRIVAFTDPGKPQSWPQFNQITIQDTGSTVVGGDQLGHATVIVETHHLHRLLFGKSPIADGGVFMAANRGAVNKRCWIIVDTMMYALDELGIYSFDGTDCKSLSNQIQSLSWLDDEKFPFKINWAWKQYFHASLDRQRQIMRWFVSMDGHRYPRYAICINYQLMRWWIEQYPLSIGGTCSGYLNDSGGIPQVYYGGEHAKVLAAWNGANDIINGDDNTLQSTVTSAGLFSLTDTAATFPTSGIVNAPLTIIKGTGKMQERRIVAVSGTTLTLDRPWNVLPDTTSVYQIGGVHWQYKSAWMRLAATEKQGEYRFEMLFEPIEEDAAAVLRFFKDFADTPESQAVNQEQDAGGGIQCVAGDPVMNLDLTKQGGLIDHRIPFAREYYARGWRYMQHEIEGFTNTDQVKIYQFLWEGLLPGGGNNS